MLAIALEIPSGEFELDVPPKLVERAPHDDQILYYVDGEKPVPVRCIR